MRVRCPRCSGEQELLSRPRRVLLHALPELRLTSRDRGTVCLCELRLRGPDHRPVCIYRQTRRATWNAGESTGSGAAHWQSLEHRWPSRNVSALPRCLRSRGQRAVPGPRRQVERRSFHRSPWRSGSHGGVFRGVSEAVSSHRPEGSLTTVDGRDDAPPAAANERRRAGVEGGFDSLGQIETWSARPLR